MNLVQCKIENFGKLHAFTYTFTPGCNVIHGVNGWGKSTLAAFLRVMFYGFEGGGKRDELANERKRYKPWQGGSYGGSVTFTVNAKTYEMTRTFGEKEAQDTFELRDAATNMPSSDFSANIGEELFEINSESFLRTVFIGQEDAILSDPTDGVHAKIGNLADSGMDLDAYEQAMERLKKYGLGLKSGNSRGFINEKKARETTLRREVREGESIPASMASVQDLLEKKQELLQQLEEERKAVGEEQSRLSKLKDVQASKEAYRKLLIGCGEKEARAREALADFPMGLPELGCLEGALKKANELERCREAELLYSLSEEESRRLLKFEEEFKDGIPSVGEFADCEAEIEELSSLKEEIAVKKLTSEEASEYRALQDCFGDFPNDEYEDATAEVSAMSSGYQKMQGLKSELAAKENSLATSRMILSNLENSQKGSGAARGLIIAGIICLIVGIVGVAVVGPMNLSDLSMGLILGAAGLALLGLILLILGIVKKKSAAKPSEEVLRQRGQLESLEAEIKRCKEEIAEIEDVFFRYLPKRGLSYMAETVLTSLTGLTTQAYTYDRLRKKAEAANVTLQEARMAEIVRSVRTFLGDVESAESFDVNRINNYSPANYQNFLNKKKHDAQEYERLKMKKEQFLQSKKSREDAEAGIAAILTGLGFAQEENLSAQLNRLSQKEALTRDFEQEALRVKKELEEYAQANSTEECRLTPELFPGDSIYREITALPELSGLQENYETLTEQIEEAKEGIKSYRNRLDQMQEQYDGWEELKEELEAIGGEIAAAEKELKLSKIAAELLTSAKNTLTGKYMDPLMQSFRKYYGFVEGDLAEYRIDANANITREEQGLQREISSLSTGYRDLVGLCKRFALVDAMYPGEKPMLILDDPFVNFDDGKGEGAKKLLDAVGQEYQVIYFTCSKSREPA